jgi:hypothetical protein
VGLGLHVQSERERAGGGGRGWDHSNSKAGFKFGPHDHHFHLVFEGVQLKGEAVKRPIPTCQLGELICVPNR